MAAIDHKLIADAQSLAADAVHEINNKLTIYTLSMEMAEMVHPDMRADLLEKAATAEAFLRLFVRRRNREIWERKIEFFRE